MHSCVSNGRSVKYQHLHETTRTRIERVQQWRFLLSRVQTEELGQVIVSGIHLPKIQSDWRVLAIIAKMSNSSNLCIESQWNMTGVNLSQLIVLLK